MPTAEAQFQRESEFQRLLIRLATRFINQPVEQMDDSITEALKQVVEFLGARRCSVNQFCNDMTQYFSLYAWSAQKGNDNDPTKIPFYDRATVLPKFIRGESVLISDTTDLPPESELRKFLQGIPVRTSVTIPLFDDGQLFGFVSVTWAQPREIDPAIVDLLRIVGEIFINAMTRKRREEEIRHFNLELEQRVADRTAALQLANEQLQQEIVERQKVEAALREGEAQLRAILESLPIPIAVIEGELDVLYLNAVAAFIFEVNQDVPPQVNAGDFYVDPRDRELVRALVQEQGFVRAYEVNYYSRDAVRAGLMSITPIQFFGHASQLVAIVDVTELKHTQDAERNHRTLTEALLDAAMVLTSTLEFEDVLGHILANLRRVLPHDVSNIIIADGDDISVFREHLSNAVGDMPRGTVQSHLSGQQASDARRLFEIDYPVLVANAKDIPLLVPDFDTVDIHSYLGMPIVVGKEIIGLLNLGSFTADYFTESHVNYLQIFALQAGTAIQNARLFTQAQTIAALEERQHLARELHDSVTQTLFAANAIAEALPVMIAKTPDAAHHYIQELHLLTRAAMAEMRSLLFELRPSTLEQTDLSVLLIELCHTFTGKTRVVVETRLASNVKLPSEVQLAFYRVAQESLNNAAKHAHAQHVTLHFSAAHHLVELRITDDGDGFEPDAITPEHFGLMLMQERALEAEAELRIESQPGSGTRIILRKQLS
jgi:signal transduction histidine kinase